MHLTSASLNAGVKRFVHISSVGAIGFHKDGTPADETVPFNWPPDFYYMVSKYQGQLVVEKAVDAGLPAVILNPASIMGPGDPNPGTPHNQLYRRIYNSTLFGSFSGGLAVVDVRDLAVLIVKALEIGESGDKFLAVGANLTYRRVIQTVGKFARRRVYPLPLPAPLFSAAGLLLEGVSALSRRPPLLTLAYGRLSGWKTYYDGGKSERVFDHRYIDFEQTIRDSCEYYEARFLKGN
jgi:dihydroflavonol-4-reductase